MGTKINQLIQQLPAGTILLSAWLNAKGYPYELQQKYRKSGWLTSVGTGAMIRTGDKLQLNGALYSLQQQSGMPIHIGGRTALNLQGLSHYIELFQKETLLVAPRGIKLPAWFRNNHWETTPVLINTSLLHPDVGLTDYFDTVFTIQISDPARAMMECLELAPDHFDLTEARQLMEGLTFLIPANVQSLLEQCNSLKVIRLFLYLAEKAGHAWFKYLKTEKIFIGKGKRSLVSQGIYIPKYMITVPESLV